jgi:CheY-like chemotaxis protein
MSQPLRIVAAADDPAMCLFYEQTLPRLGHQVHIARDGPQLVELCRAVGPDLILADVKMSGLGGVAAVAAVNREREVPAILVSAYDDLVIADVGHIMAYLVKPVRPADLNAAIPLAHSRVVSKQCRSGFRHCLSSEVPEK